MEAIAAFEHGSLFCIVFELAQCTLWTFLEGTTSLTYFSQDLWNQVQGLASGLKYLHGEKVHGLEQENENMCHMDLKPSNILIVNKVMKIADFGLSVLGQPASESILFGDSKHEGAQVYAPPARRGPPSDKIDIYSLGAIISEIACYDIGGAKEVTWYRDKRKEDRLSKDLLGSDSSMSKNLLGSDSSIRFYYPYTFATKESVINQHKRLLDATNPTGSTQIEGALDQWQETFYEQGPFRLIEKMLHPVEAERPTALEVEAELDLHIRQSSRAIRGSGIDIWEVAVHGTRLLKTKPPSRAADRL
jgi:serine/threonine protein kinase